MSAYIPVSLRRQVYRKFRGCCAYCRTPESLIVTKFEIEHILPRSAGGQTVLENLCLACPTCNRHKSYLQSAVDPVSQQTLPLFDPNVQVWDEHFRLNLNDFKLIGLTPLARATIEALTMNRPELVRMRKLWFKLGEFPPAAFSR
jgi:HNH endonuclease